MGSSFFTIVWQAASAGGLLVLLSGCSLFAPESPPTRVGISRDYPRQLSISEMKLVRAWHNAPVGPSIPRRVLPQPPIVRNAAVDDEVQFLLKREQGFVSAAIELRDHYYPLLIEIFTDEGLPPELVNLALIESGFKAHAKSRAGAKGMWQFMKSTAKLYGLRVDKREDQRRDVVLSTLAAARLLRDLYATYEDWFLALAAYNSGNGTVNRAIARSGSRDYWELSRGGYLPRETRRYVPRFIAAGMILSGLHTASDVERASFGQMMLELEEK